MSDIKQNVEALIFASGDPIETDRLCELLECTADDVEISVNEINDELKERSSALMVVKLDDAYQFVTKTEYAQPIKKMLEIQRNTPLSPAAFEVLAVVAYNQPVTKSFVEQVRGVDCSGVMSSLVEKGLIEERGRLDLPGRPLLYGTTKLFLRAFDITDLGQLPPLPFKDGGTLESYIESTGNSDNKEAAD